MTTTQKRSILYTIPLVILSVPFFAGLISNEVHWQISDFLIAGFLLFSSAMAIDLIFRKIMVRKKQWISIAIVLLILTLVWLELAVGIIGSPLAGS